MEGGDKEDRTGRGGGQEFNFKRKEKEERERRERERYLSLHIADDGTSHFTPPDSCLSPNLTHQYHQFISIQFTLSSPPLSSLFSPLPLPQAATSSPIPSPKSPNISFETLSPLHSQTSLISFLSPLVCVTKLETCYIPVIFLYNSSVVKSNYSCTRKVVIHALEFIYLNSINHFYKERKKY